MESNNLQNSKDSNLESKRVIESKSVRDSNVDSKNSKFRKFFSIKNLVILCVIIALCFFASALESRLNFSDFYFLFSVKKGEILSIILRVLLSLIFALLLILSLLDFKNLCVPNALLLLLFVLNLAMFCAISALLVIIPFALLGAFYFFYFATALIYKKEMLGSGDIWVMASISSALLFCFPLRLELIFYMLIISSALAILFALLPTHRKTDSKDSIKSKNAKQDSKDFIESKNHIDSKTTKDSIESKNTQQDSKNTKKSIESKTTKVLTDSKNTQDSIESKNTKDSIESKKTKTTKDSESPKKEPLKIPFIPFLSLAFFIICAIF